MVEYNPNKFGGNGNGMNSVASVASLPVVDVGGAEAPPRQALTLATEAATESKALVPSGSKVVSLAGVEFDVTEWNECDTGPGDLMRMGVSLPRVAISYLSSKRIKDLGVPEGLWTHLSTGAQKETLDVLYIESVHNRRFAVKYDNKAEEQEIAICESFDGCAGTGSAEFDELHPDRMAIHMLGNDKTYQGLFGIPEENGCKSCPWSQWVGRGRSQIKPACADLFHLVLHEAEWGPIVVTMKGMAVAPTKAWRDAYWPALPAYLFRWSKQHNGARVPAKLLAQFTIGRVKKEQYYVPVYGPLKMVDDERLAMVLSMRDGFDTLIERLRREGAGDADSTPFDGDGDVAQSSAPSSRQATTQNQPEPPPVGDEHCYGERAEAEAALPPRQSRAQSQPLAQGAALGGGGSGAGFGSGRSFRPSNFGSQAR